MQPTTAQVIEKVREIASERPDVRYEKVGTTCFYDAGKCSDGTCGCIFGQVFTALGVTGVTGWTGITTKLPSIVEDIPTMKQLQWCNIVQMAQDVGWSWGESVAKADKAVKV